MTTSTHLTTTPVMVPVGGDILHGDLGLPDEPRGFVLFAHGSGSSRHSERNRHVAHALARRGLATLLIDLLTTAEEAEDRRTAQWRFDIDLLGQRLTAIIDWAGQQPAIASLPIGLFGASTGGGAALVAAADRPSVVAAVVSRGGRPDLAGRALGRVRVPTLLIVGGHDTQVIELNREAMTHMRHDVALDIVPGATHLFEEPGTLDRVAQLAGDFFVRTLKPVRPLADPRDR
jgi:putative phosphoribosyl transferase